MSKYYSAENVGYRLIGGERFEVVEIHGGTAIGVFAAETPEKIAQMDALVAAPANAVSEISESEYTDWLKKKHPSLGSWKTSNPPTSPRVAIKGAGADVVEDGITTLEAVDPLLSVESALATPADEASAASKAPPKKKSK